MDNNMAFILSYLLLVLLSVTSSLSETVHNVDIKSATVFKYEGDAISSMYGAVVGRTKKWLLIGAPKDDSRKGFGSFFYCKPGKPNSCKRVPYHREAIYWNITVLDDLRQFAKDNSGGSSSFQPTLTCVTKTLSDKIFGNSGGCGRCFVTSTCKDFSNKHEKGKMFSTKTCTEAVNAALLKGSQRHVLMMNKGYWTSDDDQSLDIGASTCNEPDLYIKTDKSGKVRASSLLHNKRMDKTNGYRGLPSTMVDFDGDGEKDFVVGSSHSDLGKGIVQIFNKNLTHIGTISGKNVVMNGSEFGASVTSTDLNGDGFDDIVVGAPNGNSVSEPNGQVFIFYYNTESGYSTADYDRIEGKDQGIGHFGSVISAVGDINFDGYKDLCVGDAYDGESGKIMIYFGSKSGVLVNEPPQVIRGSDFTPPLTGLGMAVSSGLEPNGVPKPAILVGAFDAAVYLRARPVVYTDLSVIVEPNVLDLDVHDCIDPETDERRLRMTCFQIKACFKHRDPGSGEISFLFEVSLDYEMFEPRAKFSDSNNSTRNVPVTLHSDSIRCNVISAFFEEKPEWEFDIFTPIQVKSRLTWNSGTGIEREKGGLPYMLAPNEVTNTITIVKSCGEDNICIPDLNINGSLNFYENEQGSKAFMEVKFTVRNSGETAFRVRVGIRLPEELLCWRLRDMDRVSVCTGDDGSEMKEQCRLIKVMLAGDEITDEHMFDLRPDHNHTTCLSQLSNLTLFVTSENPEDPSHLADNYYVIPYEVPVKEETTTAEMPIDAMPTSIDVPMSPTYQIRLTGYNDPSTVDGDSFDGKIKHKFVVTNESPDSIVLTGLHIMWPERDTSGDNALVITDSPVVQGDGICHVLRQHPFCGTTSLDQNMEKAKNVVESHKNCTMIICVIEDMAPKSTFSVTVHSTVDVQQFFENRKEEDEIESYDIVTKATLATNSTSLEDDYQLQLITKVKRPRTSSSVRIQGDLWKFSFLVVVLALMAKLITP